LISWLTYPVTGTFTTSLIERFHNSALPIAASVAAKAHHQFYPPTQRQPYNPRPLETAMDWTADSEGVREQLMRIVALLLGLATLAERACRAPLGVRVSVIGFLLPAEQAAWAFVAGENALPEPLGEGDDPAAAMRLAASFRALAIALAAFAGRLCGCNGVRIGILRRAVEKAGTFPDPSRARLPPFDTS
jgi:hypothetical protein